MTYFDITPDMDGETIVSVLSVTGSPADFTVIGLLTDTDDDGSTAERRFVGPENGYAFGLLTHFTDDRADSIPCNWCHGHVNEVTVGMNEAGGDCNECGEYAYVYGFGYGVKA